MKRPNSSEPPIPRVVKPRKIGYTHRPIVVVELDAMLMMFESTGEVLEFWKGALRLLAEPSSIVIVQDAARLVATLDELFDTHERWQYKITPVKRPVMRSNGEMSKFRVGQTVINFFGWQRANGSSQSHYHYPLDPGIFLRGPIDGLLTDEGGDKIAALYRWGADVRSWCEKEDVKVSATSGGIAGQLLKDPRWFPEDRRKVPHHTNANVRPRLPGNFYHLYATEGDSYTALYLDMKSSHHTIAASIDFPHPDHLTARGRFHVPDEPDATVPADRRWLTPGRRGFERITTEAHGLIYGRLHVPFIREDHFPLPFMRRAGSRMVWAYTNELSLIHDLGGRWEYITAAWVSFQKDEGLNKYAKYALAELASASDERKKWLKPTLLSTYGVLASQERTTEVAFRQAEGGEPRAYPAGSTMLRAKSFVGSRPQESGVTNVLYRGLIEAEQRVRALALARDLAKGGHRVLAIYADSLFIEGTNAPLLPDGWRIEAELDGLVFDSATHFTSRQLSKLPGVRKDASQRVQLLANARGHDRPRTPVVRRSAN